MKIVNSIFLICFAMYLTYGFWCICNLLYYWLKGYYLDYQIKNLDKKEYIFRKKYYGKIIKRI